MRPWHWKVLVGVALVWCLVGVFRLLGYRLSWHSESMPGGIYRLVDTPIEDEGIAIACLPGFLELEGLDRGLLFRKGSFLSDCPSGVVPVLKIVIDRPGARVCPTERGLLVDGVFWAHWTLLDGVPKLADCAVLEDGLVWLYAPNPRSWDSRYYGAVPGEALASAAVRVF